MPFLVTKENPTIFFDYLNQIKSGSIIEINNDVIIDINEPLVIPPYVTIKSSYVYPYGAGGAKFNCLVEAPELVYKPTFHLMEGVRLIGLRFQGTNSNILTHDRISKQVNNPIYVNGKDCLITCCEVYDGDKWGIWVANPSGHVITNNFIHHCKLAGYGYGIWLGGRSGVYVDESEIYNNIIDHCRSGIDGNAGPLNAVISNNRFGRSFHHNVLTRHANNQTAQGFWTVCFNVILNEVNRSISFPSQSLFLDENVYSNNIWVNEQQLISSSNTPEKLMDRIHTIGIALKDNRLSPDENIQISVAINKTNILVIPGGAYDNWRKLYIPVDFLIQNTKSGTLSINVQCVNAPLNDDYTLWIDDIELIGGNTLSKTIGFENGLLTPMTQKPNGWGTRIVQEECFSGKFSARFSAQKGKFLSTGSFSYKF